MIKTNRIDWIDIFKAFAIMLVVLGHSTGKFNIYVYQFHMAAFFLISGYTANLERKKFSEILWLKFMTLLLPLFSIFILFLILISILNTFGIYNIFFDSEFLGFNRVLNEFFFHGSNYINLLGATWFVIILFGVFILQKLICIISRNYYGVIYSLLSLFFFILGYFLVSAKQSGSFWIFPFDLVFIGQFYFFIGVMLQKYKIFEKINTNKIANLLLLGVTACLLYYFGNINISLVDYPSRTFGNIFFNMIASINGSIFVYCLSYYSSMLPQKIKYYIILIGQNTLGILFFHFLAFKLSFLILALLGIVPFSYISSFIPTNEIGVSYWWFIFPLSIFVSIVLWLFLIKPKFCKIIFGQNTDLYKSIYLEFSLFFNSVLSKLKLKFPLLNINKILIFLICSIAFIILAPMINTGIIQNDELQNRLTRFFTNKMLSNAGSNLKSAIKLYGYEGDGWLLKESEFQIRTGTDGVIVINGYYPNDLKGNETGTIFINNVETLKYEVKQGEFVIDVPAPKNEVVNIKIVSDFIFVSPPDVRELTFILSDMQGK